MEAKELRIGNLVTQIIEKSTHNEEKTITIEWQELMWISRDRSSKYKPIPLTEEWLLNFGFEKDLDKSLVKNNIAIFLDKRFKTNLFLQENQDNFKWFSYELKVEYVHQLQNIYFALTGEELTLID